MNKGTSKKTVSNSVTNDAGENASNGSSRNDSSAKASSGSSISRKRRRLAFTAVGVVLIMLLLIGLARALDWQFAGPGNVTLDPATEIRVLPVTVSNAEFVDEIEQQRTYTGTIRAKRQADLGFELTGRVDRVLCDEGDLVKQGDALAFLDIKGLQARHAAIAASLAQANAVLSELQAGPRVQTIDSMRAQLKEANSNMKLAELTLTRRKSLRKSSAISKEEYDRALYTFRSAQSQVDSTQNQLKELEAGTRSERLVAQEAAVKQLESSLAEIDVQIEKSSIVAPFGGRIVERMVDPGGIATASQSLLKLVESDNLEAVIGIPADTARKLKVDQQFSIVVGEREFSATLIAKIQQLDISTRTQNLIFQLARQADGTVLPGQLCQIEIATKIPADGFWVPSSALTNGIRGLWSLMIVDEDSSQAIRTDVQLVYADGDRALVQGSINSGTQVIVEGTHRIVEGQKVQPVLKQAQREQRTQSKQQNP